MADDQYINGFPSDLSECLDKSTKDKKDLDYLTKMIFYRDECRCPISGTYYYKEYPPDGLSEDELERRAWDEVPFKPETYAKEKGYFDAKVVPIIPLHKFASGLDGPLSVKYQEVFEIVQRHFPAIANYITTEFSEADYFSPTNLISLWTREGGLDDAFRNLAFWFQYEETVPWREARGLNELDDRARFWGRYSDNESWWDATYDVYRCVDGGYWDSRVTRGPHNWWTHFSRRRVIIPQTSVAPCKVFFMIHSIFARIAQMLGEWGPVQVERCLISPETTMEGYSRPVKKNPTDESLGDDIDDDDSLDSEPLGFEEELEEALSILQLTGVLSVRR
ncbi:hypothetical protein TWF281_004363 [Arthrobotrys megalospora]